MVSVDFTEEIKGRMWSVGEAYYYLPIYKGFRFGERIKYRDELGIISAIARVEYRSRESHYVITLTMDEVGRGENGYPFELSEILGIEPSLDHDIIVVNDVNDLEHTNDCYKCRYDCKREEKCEMHEPLINPPTVNGGGE